MVLEFHSVSFRGILLRDCETQMRVLNRYSGPMPWIGMYIAAASAVCAILMALDLFYAIRWRKYWMPSKYFTLNAATLTFLGVVVKLLLDISTPVPRDIDMFAKESSLQLMITIMLNFSSSLGSMDDKSLVSNMIALVILVVTVIVNIIIQVNTGLVLDLREGVEYLLPTSIIYVLSMLINFAFFTRSVKGSTEVHYRHKYKMVLNEEHLREGKVTTARLELVIKKFWIMAVTSNPQFVIGSCLWVMYFIPAMLTIRIIHHLPTVFGFASPYLEFHKVGPIFSSSDYSWSTIWILRTQVMGIFIGFISFFVRFLVFIFKPVLTIKVLSSHIRATEHPLQFQIGTRKCRKLLSCIYQSTIIFIPVVFYLKIMVMCILFILEHAKRFCHFCILKLKGYMCVHRTGNSSVQREQEAELAHLAGYAMCLNLGQPGLSMKELRMIYYEQHQLIQTGKRKQPKNLFQLLQRSNSFIGVNDFDRIKVPSLHTKEPPTCWTLPVMTLAKIAIALPQEDSQSFDNIIKSVTEGLKYADLVDKSLEDKHELQKMRMAVQVMWLDVELDHKWLNVKPIMRKSREAKFSKDILQDLADTAKNRVVKFKEGINELSIMDHQWWPEEVLAANSMYRISSSLLLAYDEEGNAQTTAGDDDGLLEKILNMIADILSACLTNLPYVMTQECYDNTIGRRENKARHMSRLFGECEEILKLLESREVPPMDPEKALCIDEWQAYFSQGNADGSTPIPNNVNASPSPEVEHVANAVPSPVEEHVLNTSPSHEELQALNASPSPRQEHVVDVMPSPEIEHVANPSPSPCALPFLICQRPSLFLI